MQYLTYIILAFAVIAAIDRVIGNRFKLGEQFEKGIMMLGPLTLSMAGMLIMAPVIADLLSVISGVFPDFLDFSIIPASLLANDMGGAPLAAALADDTAVGSFNGLVVSSMMGCTVSFTLPFAMQMTDRKHHSDILFGLLCGIVTIPIGCAVSGIICGIAPIKLILDLLPLVLFAAAVAVGIIFFERVTVMIFRVLGVLIQAIITFGLVIGAIEFVVGFKLIESADTLDSAMSVIVNIACIMLGAFPILMILKKLLSRPMKLLGKRLGINEDSSFGFLSTVGTSVSTFEAVGRMDRRGVILNSAFAVSASFVFVDHLAFTMAFDQSYVPAVIAGKLFSGICALVLAYFLCKKVKKI